MKDFKQLLYEAFTTAFGKVLAKYNVFAHGAVLRDIGREIIEYLVKNGFDFKEEGNLEDMDRLIDHFVQSGFAESLEILPEGNSKRYIWHDVYGAEAYEELHAATNNAFLSCPLNLCLFYLCDKHGKTMLLHEKSFDLPNRVVVSRYEVVDKPPDREDTLDQLVIENARLYQLAQDRAEKLKKALDEIKTLKGILPICASCKKIRDDQGYWNQIEAYIRDHSDALFTHSICPDCMKKLYPEYVEDEPDELEDAYVPEETIWPKPAP